MPRQEPRVNDLDVVERWLQLSNQADDVLCIWQRLKHRQLAETCPGAEQTGAFWIWYLRLIRERSSLGLEVDTAWKIGGDQCQK